MGEEDKGRSRGLSGFLGGVSDLVERLEKLAESGGKISRTGTFPVEGPEGQKEAGGGRRATKGVYGFSVKLGAGGRELQVEPFGNPLRRGRAAGGPREEDEEQVREPLVDVFDEEDRLLIVAEMPGIEPEDVRVDLQGDSLTFSAARGERRYRKSVSVPRGTRREQVSFACKNGILEVSCAKPPGA